MALIPPFFVDCVTAIGFRGADPPVDFRATGFLYGKLVTPATDAQPSQYRVYLITNRHVFENQKEAVVRFNPAAGAPARTYDLDLVDQSGTPLWSVHADAAVDVAAIPINVQLLRQQGIQFSFFNSDQHVLSRSAAVQQGVSEGDGVFVLGFPLGDVGGERNYVVVRQGVIARIRDALAGAAKTFLIDATVFPGNSGGPVVTKPEVVAISGTQPRPRADLIGIVSAYVPYRDVAFSLQTQRPRVIFEENTGLAVVVPVDSVMEVVEVADARFLQAAGSQGAA